MNKHFALTLAPREELVGTHTHTHTHTEREGGREGERERECVCESQRYFLTKPF